MSKKIPLAAALLLSAFVAFPALAVSPAPITVIAGATVLDLTHRGRSTHDIVDAIVLLQAGKILAVGERGTTPIPPGAQIIDAKGKFLVPGLVDGFTGLQNQAEANAELYEGVTTIVGSGDDRRGHLDEHANPSPHLYALDSAGSTDDWSLLRDDPSWHDKLADGGNPSELSAEDTARQLEATARRGTRVIWLGHNVTEANTATIIEAAHRLGMVTYGEFIATPYPVAMADGVDALLHTSRYELGMAPLGRLAALAADPEGPAAGPAYADAMNQPPAIVHQYGELIAKTGTALIPTFSLFYATMPGHRNLWKEPAAANLEPSTLSLPTDPASGDVSLAPEKLARLTNLTQHLWFINGSLFDERPLYLAASGASALGALPGVSLHVEMELLVRLGLTPREALAAATSNYAQKFGWRELGLVAPGRRADLLLLASDPTLDIRNADRIDGVFLAGAPLDRNRLMQRP